MSPAKKDKGEAPRAYLLKGDDDYLKHRELEKLLASLVAPDFADFDLQEIDGDHATTENLLAGLCVPPLASKQRVVLVKHANKMSAEEQEKLAAKIKSLPKSACLVLVNPAAEKVDGRVRKGSEVVGALSRAVRSVGEVKDFGKMRAGDAKSLAKSLFVQAGKKIEPRAFEEFIQRAGTDSSILVSEITKLATYVGDADTITSADVQAVVSETPEEKVFKLIDAISARKASSAIQFLDELFELGDDPDADAPKTLATIARHFRLLWQMRYLQEMGVRSFSKSSVPDEVKDTLPSDPNVLDVLGRQAWMAERMAKQARAFSRGELMRCFDALSRADLKLKGIEGDMENPRLIMELLVVELVGAGKQVSTK